MKLNVCKCYVLAIRHKSESIWVKTGKVKFEYSINKSYYRYKQIKIYLLKSTFQIYVKRLVENCQF